MTNQGIKDTILLHLRIVGAKTYLLSRLPILFPFYSGKQILDAVEALVQDGSLEWADQPGAVKL